MLGFNLETKGIPTLSLQDLQLMVFIVILIEINSPTYFVMLTPN